MISLIQKRVNVCSFLSKQKHTHDLLYIEQISMKLLQYYFKTKIYNCSYYDRLYIKLNLNSHS